MPYYSGADYKFDDFHIFSTDVLLFLVSEIILKILIALVSPWTKLDYAIVLNLNFFREAEVKEIEKERLAPWMCIIMMI